MGERSKIRCQWGQNLIFGGRNSIFWGRNAISSYMKKKINWPFKYSMCRMFHVYMITNSAVLLRYWLGCSKYNEKLVREKNQLRFSSLGPSMFDRCLCIFLFEKQKKNPAHLATLNMPNAPFFPPFTKKKKKIQVEI